MCTLSYIPKKKGSFILVHNRDEAGDRNSAKIPVLRTINHQKVTFPIDAKTGGTWIGASDRGRFISLLNGAFKKHKHSPPYRMSRGHIINEYFETNGIYEFYQTTMFTDIEPFTLFIIEGQDLFELRWDGKNKYLKHLDPKQAHFYSSATLYTNSQHAERKNWFKTWHNNNPKPSFKELVEFHHQAGQDDQANALIMNRNELVKTVSITAIESFDDKFIIDYENLIDKRKFTKEIPFHKLN